MVYLDFPQPHIVAIQETKTDISLSTSEMFPESSRYSVYRKNRNSDGGVMLLIHKDISHMPITELENYSESVWFKCSQLKLPILLQIGFNLLVEIG